MTEMLETRRKRLQEYEEQSLLPFARAEATTDCSVYWCGVREFPVNSYERAWLLEFLLRLAGYLEKTRKLREADFFQHKFLMGDLLELFIKRSEDYIPVAGLTLIPGTEPIKIPTATEMYKQAKEDQDNKRDTDLKQWMPDYAHLFLDPQTAAQRTDFLGHGGMFGIYLKPDPREGSRLPELPRLLTSNPGFDPGIYRQHAVSMAFQDPWLTESKQIFGEPFLESAGSEAIPFVLPLLTSGSLLAATPDERARWFDLFDAYWIESKPDKGVLLVLKYPHFDPELIDLLEGMRLDGHTFRSIL